MAGARKSLEAALAIQPEKAEAVDALAKTYTAGKDTDKALQIVQTYVAMHPRSAPLQNLLGNWMAANGRFDDARKAFLASLTAAPSFVDARIAAAYVELADGKLDQARKFFESIPRTPQTQVRCELGLAQVEEKSKNPAAAVQHYRKALEADPSNVPALNSIAYLLANDTGQADEALKFAQQAQELAPNNTFVEDTIGWAYFRKGLYSNAVDHLQRAVAKTDLAVIRYHLAMAYMKAGDTEKGRSMFRQASVMDPGAPEALAALKIMKEVGTRNN
jgi:Tfp pilus assembly protein PilF